MSDCAACGYPLDEEHNQERCDWARRQLETSACEQSGHMLQGDTCYCGLVTQPWV